MTDQLPSKERIGFLIEYWTAKLGSHQRWPEGHGLQAELMGLIYVDTIAALKQLPKPAHEREPPQRHAPAGAAMTEHVHSYHMGQCTPCLLEQVERLQREREDAVTGLYQLKCFAEQQWESVQRRLGSSTPPPGDVRPEEC